MHVLPELLKPYSYLQPHQTGHLQVSGLHRIYYEVSGNPNGKPALVVHGGPGGGSQPEYRRYFDPAVYRIVQFDQRGCGQSTPHASLEDNTMWHLVTDMEQLRELLGIERWLVFGGSWGSTLSLAYAQTHPERVSELILRGIFLLRRKELHWFYQEGANFICPDAWEAFLEPIPSEERDNLMAAYYRRLTCDDHMEQLRAAQAWSIWEASTLSLYPNPQRVNNFSNPEFALAFARIECHYFMNAGFLERDGQLLENMDHIRQLPGVIIQGRYDITTPMRSAWDLHRAWPEAEFRLVPDAGHAASEPGIVHEFIRATRRFAQK
ncbi:MAG: prolyl aminopeptidase [Deltaproteobacteria bacterium]|jgi:proline iminopeptidase|nr:prolyl aminopeptidase [Deltaproteobacteria bacterium]